ncbi:unnamed protein product [Adineta steineri]|uniref:Uncharacterized protein n=1 Tax=Adineta steineri TaxID=433720 RepID=A0A818IZ79_9BILA|nr:unnamed protein product [Adineta steineri]CAF1141826.1 unnamed protein product [Adineta steineri]CAF3483483.1 unnamed protein product [Adineta steineri]CAF3527850.1 unnamed protein product [Adineta steineri]
MEQSKTWYGHLEAPLRELEAGEGKQMGVLQIRGYKKANTATGATHSLCFRIATPAGKLNAWLNIYLQVGYSASNYFGWFISDTPQCLDPQTWYNNGISNANRDKASCSDRVLNKGGQNRLSADCFGFLSIIMYTDNMSLSTPSMSITWNSLVPRYSDFWLNYTLAYNSQLHDKNIPYIILNKLS